MTARKKRYDYEGIIRSCPEADIRRILRKLVREAAIMGHGEIDSLGTLSEQREQADRIAKELVP